MGNSNPVKDLGQIFSGNQGGASFNDVMSHVKDAFAPPPPPAAPPDPFANADLIAAEKIKKDAQARRASRTLFTGGTGVLDQPTSASNVLLGS